jgi:putative DNA-invertase from lambdoid prophage Rac
VVIEYVLEESAFNGKHRGDLNQALEDARLGRYDVLSCLALDRMERGGVEATLALLRRFRERGVAVWSMKESWTETSDPRMAELLTAIYAWMAAEESRRRSERVKAGLDRRRAEGKRSVANVERRIRPSGAFRLHLPLARRPAASDDTRIEGGCG